MDKIRIQGGVALKGKVALSGAKNAALPIMAAALLADGPSTFTNLPVLRDIQTHKRLLAHLGATFKEGSPAELMIDPSGFKGFEAPYELVKTMRASVLVLGPLVARLGKAWHDTAFGNSIREPVLRPPVPAERDRKSRL